MIKSIIEYRTTHCMRHALPGAYKSTSNVFIKLYKTKILKKIKLFPDDLVVAWFTVEDEKELLRRFHPAKLDLYKYIWDNASEADRNLLCKHLKRSIDVRNQFKKGLFSDDVRVWYMSLVLGGTDA